MSKPTHNYKKSTIISVGNDKPKSQKSSHYVDNKQFYAALQERKDLLAKAEEENKSPPQVSEFIGRCILQIANNLSRKSNFINYKFREEMVSDAVLNCIQYVDNFDPAKSKNPFSYFTQVCYYAFIGRIANEKKQTYVKFRSTINSTAASELADISEDREDLEHMFDNFEFNNDYMEDFVETYEKKNSLGAHKKPRSGGRGAKGRTALEKEISKMEIQDK